MIELLTAIGGIAGALALAFRLGDHKIAALWAAFVMCIAGITVFFWWYHGVLRKQEAAKGAQGEEIAAGERAYLVIQPGPLIDFAPGLNTGAEVKVKNIGKTPAYDVTLERFIAISRYPLPDDEPFPSAPQPISAPVTLVPGAEVSSIVEFDPPLSEEVIREVMDGNKRRLYLAALVKYKDVRGENHHTRFMAFVGGPRFMRQAEIAKSQGQAGLFWEYTTRFNESD